MILQLAAAAVVALAPGCRHATITENSGNGPTVGVVICGYALRDPGPGKRWLLIEDGSAGLHRGAVFIGAKVPRDD